MFSNINTTNAKAANNKNSKRGPKLEKRLTLLDSV